MTKINPEKFYTPNEAAEICMQADTPNSRRQLLLRFIREGRIQATNLGGDRKPRYVVQGKDIVDYQKAVITRGKYIKK